MEGSFRGFGNLPAILLSDPTAAFATAQHGKRRVILLALAACWLVAACSGTGPGEAEAAEAETRAAPVATSSPAPATTSPTSTTTSAVPTTTSTTTTTTSTTTTTLPPLDRSDEAAEARLEADIAFHGLDQPRVGGSDAEAVTAAAIAETVGAITGSEPVIDLVALPNGDISTNVWAEPQGTGDASLLLGAHIDSVEISPGVDDNGSGTVVLLELLRRLAEEPPDGVVVGIVFFGAEEVLPGYSSNDHHYGSRHAAALLAAADTLPDFMVSVDMVGLGDRLMAVAYEDTDPAMALAIAAAGQRVGVEVTTLSRGDISDHEAFARLGVPAAFMWRPDNAAWHTADDDTLDTSHLLENLQVLEELIISLGASGS